MVGCYGVGDRDVEGHRATVSETTPMVLAERTQSTMALDQSALLELLEALKAAEVDDRIGQATETLYQALIEAELTAVLGAGAGTVTHPSAIRDARVADALQRQCGWTPQPAGGECSPAAYGSYCRLLARWAAVASEQWHRAVGIDELERGAL